MSTLALRAKVSALASRYAVGVSYRNLGDVAGETDGTGGSGMTLNSTLDNETELLSAFYHELGHIHCTRTGLHKEYHDPALFHRSKKYCDWREAWKVERWVDRWAEREARQSSPGLRVYKAYYEEPVAVVKRTIQPTLPRVCKRGKSDDC